MSGDYRCSWLLLKPKYLYYLAVLKFLGNLSNIFMSTTFRQIISLSALCWFRNSSFSPTSVIHHPLLNESLFHILPHSSIPCQTQPCSTSLLPYIVHPSPLWPSHLYQKWFRAISWRSNILSSLFYLPATLSFLPELHNQFSVNDCINAWLPDWEICHSLAIFSLEVCLEIFQLSENR